MAEQPNRYEDPAYCKALEEERDFLRDELKNARLATSNGTNIALHKYILPNGNDRPVLVWQNGVPHIEMMDVFIHGKIEERKIFLRPLEREKQT